MRLLVQEGQGSLGGSSDGSDIEKVKTELNEFGVEEFEEDKKALEYNVKGDRFNSCDVEKVKTEPKEFENEESKDEKKELVAHPMLS